MYTYIRTNAQDLNNIRYILYIYVRIQDDISYTYMYAYIYVRITFDISYTYMYAYTNIRVYTYIRTNAQDSYTYILREAHTILIYHIHICTHTGG